jgi:AraC family transcriptional regulator
VFKKTAQKLWSCADEFRGEQLCRRDVGGIVLHASRYQPHSRVALHKHHDAYVCVLVGGPLHERVGAVSWTHGPLTLIAHPAEEEHEDAFEGAGLCVNLSIASAWISNCLEDASPWYERRAFDRGPELFLGLRLLQVYALRLFDSESLDLEEIAGEFLTAAQHIPWCRATPPRLSLVLEQLESDPAASLRLSDYARLADVHPVYLARLFRKAFGMSVGEYQRHTRLRHAVRLLTSTCLPISHVASDSGFSDQSHLTHLLKRSTGFTPKALRSACMDVRVQVQRIQDQKLGRR